MMAASKAQFLRYASLPYDCDVRKVRLIKGSSRALNLNFLICHQI